MEIHFIEENDLEKVRLINLESGTIVDVLPKQGAVLNRYSIGNNGNTMDCIDGYQTLEDYESSLETTFKSAVLAPFPNRIEGGQYTFDEQVHALELNFPDEGNAIHGLIYKHEFQVSSYSADHQCATLTLALNYGGTTLGFPYHFRCEVKFELTTENQLTQSVSITNQSDREFPFGVGLHPYFKLDQEVDSLMMSLPKVNQYVLADAGIPTGEKVEYPKFDELSSLKETLLDDCFAVDSGSKVVLDSSSAQLSIDLNTSNQEVFDHLQIYTPPHRKSIAIEPMTCPPNVFNNKINEKTLTPGESSQFSWTLLLSQKG